MKEELDLPILPKHDAKRSMRGRRIIPGIAVIAVVTAWGVSWGGGAEDPASLDVAWAPDYRSLCFGFMERRICYPDEMLRAAFPSPGAPPEFRFAKNWPLVSMTARWSVSTKGWPEKYRKDAIDLIIMYACDAELYEYIFPESIRASAFTYPPAFLAQADDPRYDLAGALRGKEVEYEVTAKGGFGAADCLIKTRIRIGVGADRKTVFYHDKPYYISDYLKSREIVFAGRDAGDLLVFEVRMQCECGPALLFRGETMRRIEENGRYFVRRLYEDLDEPPTAEDIENYFRLVGGGKHSREAYLQNRGLSPGPGSHPPTPPPSSSHTSYQRASTIRAVSNKSWTRFMPSPTYCPRADYNLAMRNYPDDSCAPSLPAAAI